MFLELVLNILEVHFELGVLGASFALIVLLLPLGVEVARVVVGFF